MKVFKSNAGAYRDRVEGLRSPTYFFKKHILQLILIVNDNPPQNILICMYLMSLMLFVQMLYIHIYMYIIVWLKIKLHKICF